MHPKQIDIKFLFALHQEKEKFLEVRPARKQFPLTTSTQKQKVFHLQYYMPLESNYCTQKE